MDFRDTLHLTWASIRTHKLRSLLAAVGVVLGIASVIGVVTLGAGIQESVLGSITSEFDAELVSVTLEREDAMHGPPTNPDVYAFTDRDVDALLSLDGVAEGGATVPLNGMEVRQGNSSLPGVRVHAHRGAHFTAPAEGRGLQGPDDVLVSNLTAQRLMNVLGTNDVLGTELTLRYTGASGQLETATLTIVGVEKPSQFEVSESITVDARFAPQVPVEDERTRVWQGVFVRAESAGEVPDVKSRMQAYLEEESDARELKGERLVFRYDTQEDIAELVATGVGQFTAFIGAIGGVSLLVGLVGIANIMLVSVQERTREIGVMKATGASRRDVLLVFLVESVAICIVGAILGIGLGSLMGMGLGSAVTAMSPGADPVPFTPVPEWYAIAVLLGVGVGLVAGVYPASRAAKVSPIEALRYE